MRQSNPTVIKLLDGVNIRTVTSSTNASPIVVTSAAHGLSTGDEIVLSGHTTNTNANGEWTVTKVSADTFSLDDSTGNGVGGATGAFMPKISPINVKDFRHKEIEFYSTDSAIKLLVKDSNVISSPSQDLPDWGAAATASNRWYNVETINTEDQTDIIPGDTGLAVGDNAKKLAINTNGSRWITVVPTAATGGASTTVILSLFNEE